MEYLYLFLATVVLFHRAVKLGYIVDDVVMYQFWKKRKSYSLEKFPIKSRVWHALHGAGVFRNRVQEHFFTLAVHYINCCLIYKVSGSLLASLLYLCNPVNNQVALWLNGRRYQIGILCALLIWNFKWLFIPLYAFAVWIHVGIVALPILVMFTMPTLYGLVSSILGAAVLYVFGWKKISGRFKSRRKDFAKDNELQKLRPGKLVVYVKCLGFYFFHTILPNKPRMYHEFMYYFSRYPSEIKRGYSFNFEFFKGLAVVAFIGYEIFVQYNVWAIWWIVFISQWCMVVTVTQNVADRYCSLAGVGLMVILAKYVNLLPAPYMHIVYTFLFTFYILRYLPLFWAYQNIDNFHKYHINIQPDAIESRSLQAVRYLRMNDAFSAFAVLKVGLRYRPNDFKLLITMSQTFFALNLPEKGLQVLDIAGKYIPVGEEEDFRREAEKIRNHPGLGGRALNRDQRRKKSKRDKAQKK